MSTTWIRVAYGVVLALVLFFTVAFGVMMVFPGPTPPGDPEITFRQLTSGDSDASQNRLTAAIDQYYSDSKNYRDDYVGYQRNVFLAGSGLAVLLALIGVALPVTVNYMRWGLLVGAAFALAWAGYVAAAPVPNPGPTANSVLALVSAGEPPPLEFAGRFLRFAISFVSLILLLFIGLWRLTEWPASSRRAPALASNRAPTAAPVVPAPAPATETTAWAPADSAAPAVGEPAAPRAEPAAPPPTEAVRWQRPSEAGEPSRQPDGPL
jgi:hypothetical protein